MTWCSLFKNKKSINTVLVKSKRDEIREAVAELRRSEVNELKKGTQEYEDFQIYLNQKSPYEKQESKCVIL